MRDVAIGRLDRRRQPRASRGFLDDGGARARSAPRSRTETRGFALTVRGRSHPAGPLASLAPRGIVLDERARLRRAHVSSREGTTIQLAIDGLDRRPPPRSQDARAEPVPVDGKLDALVRPSPDAIAVDHARSTLGAAAWTATAGFAAARRSRASSISASRRRRAWTSSRRSRSSCAGPLDGIAMTGTFGGRARLSIDLAAPAWDGVDARRPDRRTSCTVTAEPPAADVTTLAGQRPSSPRQPCSVGKGEPAGSSCIACPRTCRGAFVSAEDGTVLRPPRLRPDPDRAQLRDRSARSPDRARRLDDQPAADQERVPDAAPQPRSQGPGSRADLAPRVASRQARRSSSATSTSSSSARTCSASAPPRSYWFDASPRELTIKQAAFLAALTSEPTIDGPAHSPRRRRSTRDSAARVDIILRAMRRDGVISHAKS